MKLSQKAGIFGVLVAALWIVSLCTSCIREDRDDCPGDSDGIRIHFRYTYNMTESNAFGNEADKVAVWVFGENGKLVTFQEEEGEHIVNGFSLALPSLPVGKYTFVAWAKSLDEEGELAQFAFPKLVAGESVLNDLTAYLNRNEDNVCCTRLNGLLSGTMKAEVKGSGEEEFTINMLKCTNTLRVILMPVHSEQQLKLEDYSFVIDGKNGWLDYKADPYRNGDITYKPYYQEELKAPDAEVLADNGEGETIDNAVVAELNTSRFMYEQAPRFRIVNNRTGKNVLDINLTWFLSLQAVGEHREEWSNQEYLDRQDTYAITFFIDGDTFLQSRIIVNGWVVSLEDVSLG